MGKRNLSGKLTHLRFAFITISTSSVWEQAQLCPEKSGTDLSTQAGLCLNSLQICAVNSNAGVSRVIYAAFELRTGTKYSRAVAVNHRERADLFQRQPAWHDVPLYEKNIINLLLLFGLPRLPKLFLFSAETCLGPAVVHTLTSG